MYIFLIFIQNREQGDGAFVRKTEQGDTPFYYMYFHNYM